MAVENAGQVISLKAVESLADDQYRIVVLAAGPTVGRPNASTDIPFGVLQNAPASGEAAVVMVSGVSKIVFGETVAIGELVKLEYNSATDAGKGLDADTANDNALGICITGGAEDELGEMLITGNAEVNVAAEVT